MENETSLMANEPVIAKSMTSYADAMMMIYTMHLSREVKERIGRRLVTESTDENLSNAFIRLDHLATLEAGWDGGEALPISNKVIRNLKNVLLISDDEDWANWMISPDGNATVMLQSKKRRASISVGANEFSYYVNINGKRSGESHVKFDPYLFLSVLRKIK